MRGKETSKISRNSVWDRGWRIHVSVHVFVEDFFLSAVHLRAWERKRELQKHLPFFVAHACETYAHLPENASTLHIILLLLTCDRVHHSRDEKLGSCPYNLCEKTWSQWEIGLLQWFSTLCIRVAEELSCVRYWISYNGNHTTDIIQRTSYYGHHTTNIIQRTSYHEHHTLDILLRTSYNGKHTTDIRHHTTNIISRTSCYGHHTTDIIQRISYNGHHTTDITEWTSYDLEIGKWTAHQISDKHFKDPEEEKSGLCYAIFDGIHPGGWGIGRQSSHDKMFW